jgi:hypothetical protein
MKGGKEEGVWFLARDSGHTLFISEKPSLWGI